MDFASHCLGNTVDDSQTKTAAAGGAIAAGVETNKRLEHFLPLSGRDTWTIIFDAQRCARTLQRQADLNSFP